MIELFLVRHGKTVWNQEHRLQGARGNSELLEENIHHIDALAARLKSEDFAAIYSSPLKRAFQTASRLAADLNYQKPIQIAEALREIDFGVIEGKRDEELKPEYQEQVKFFFNEPEKYDQTVLKGESYLQAAQRTKMFVMKLLEIYPDHSKIVLVSHGGILNVMINALLEIPLKDYRRHGGITNVSLTKVDVLDDGSAKLVTFNNTEHLENLEPTDTI
ncbi:histidine phosphatase family protein [Xylocopilactobacillus apicola]|uniref:Phosphoglycerate mutase n=1 Tax=Xylocopilactobacillus apicola TaxID=2932184 RepID=A0AAU9D9R5_9LACO|nr:histidine phosphatase family protein [Xylocopilactobacillus apicola]BDR58240.1 phosphoglycerate mutase [Xylocopilactobacillus apicola]